MLDIAMIGGTYEPDMLNEMTMKYRYSGYGVDVPACVFQWKMIEGLSQNTQVRIHLINERRVPTFPNSKVIFVKREKWECEKADTATHFSFINLPILKKVSKVIGIISELQILHKTKGHNIQVVLIYGLHTPYLLASSLYVKINKVKQILLIPDLPKYMNFDSISIMKRVLKQIDALLHKWLIKYVDGFLLLTKYISDFYNIKDENYIILEGIADLKTEQKTEAINKKKAILYTGALVERYGIMKLISAYEKCKDIGELWICGEGPAKKKIEAVCKKNKNIKYFGQITREEVLKKQSEATLLVNPRDSSDEYTKYSFPSKTMEYLQSGTPVLMSRLKGIPEEYGPYIFWIEDESTNGWATEMQRIMNLSEEERNQVAVSAQQFIMKNKTSLFQANRIISFLLKVINNP